MRKQTVMALVISLTTPIAVNAEEYYLGIEIGAATSEAGISNLTGTASLDDEDVMGRLLIGFPFNDRWSLELQASDYGDVKLKGGASGGSYTVDQVVYALAADELLKAEGNGYAIGARYRWDLGAMKPYIRFGFHWWDVKYDTTSGLPSENGHDPFYGVGLGFALSPRSELRIGFEQYEMDDVDAEVEIVTIGYLRSF